MSVFQPVSNLLIRCAGIMPGYSVLDVATGTGEAAFTIAKIVGPQGRVVGVDVSPEMLRVAKQRATYKGLTNVTFQVNKENDLAPFQDDTFDAVVCRFGLMLTSNPLKALEGFRRVLKSNRKASVSVWSSQEKAVAVSRIEVIAKHVPDITSPSAISIVGQDMLGDIFTRAGFCDFGTQTTEPAVQLDSIMEYWQVISDKLLNKLVHLLSKLPTEKKQAIRKDIAESMRRLFPADPVKFTGEPIVGTGTKP